MKKQADGKRLGADHFYATSDPETFKKLQGQFDLIVNTVPAANDWNSFVNLLGTDGALVMVGVPDEAVSIEGFPFIAKRRTIAGSLIEVSPKLRKCWISAASTIL